MLPQKAANDELSLECLGYHAPVTAILLQLASSSWLPCVLTAFESCVEACWGAAQLSAINPASPLKKVTCPHEEPQWDGQWNGWFILVWGLTMSLAHSWGNLAVSLSVLFWMEDPLGVASLIFLCCEIWKIFSEQFLFVFFQSLHTRASLTEPAFHPFFFLPLFYRLSCYFILLIHNPCTKKTKQKEISVLVAEA